MTHTRKHRNNHKKTIRNNKRTGRNNKKLRRSKKQNAGSIIGSVTFIPRRILTGAFVGITEGVKALGKGVYATVRP